MDDSPRDTPPVSLSKRISPSRVARFYFHECERFLRYSATPVAARGAEGVPELAWSHQPVTEAILEGGYAWEEAVIAALDSRVRVAEADPQTPVRDRFFTREDSRDALTNLQPQEFLYQAALLPPHGFYERYGLDPDVVRLSECRPDLIECEAAGDGQRILRIVDVKASPGVKLSHRVQATLYSLILEHVLVDWGITGAVVAQDAGIWLAQRGDFDRFDVRSLRPPLETFLEHELQPLLAQPAHEARWHVYYRCEWCEYFQHCRGEMRERDDVSRVPYLSTHAKRYLSELTPPVTTVPEFGELIADPTRADAIEECASLSGRERRLARQIEALTADRVETYGGHSAAMPRAEHVRLIVTLQNETGLRPGLLLRNLRAGGPRPSWGKSCACHASGTRR